MCASRGLPAIGLYCFGWPGPAREPRPAATTRIARSKFPLIGRSALQLRSGAVSRFSGAASNFSCTPVMERDVAVVALHKMIMM